MPCFWAEWAMVSLRQPAARPPAPAARAPPRAGAARRRCARCQTRRAAARPPRPCRRSPAPGARRPGAWPAATQQGAQQAARRRPARAARQRGKHPVVRRARLRRGGCPPGGERGRRAWAMPQEEQACPQRCYQCLVIGKERTFPAMHTVSWGFLCADPGYKRSLIYCCSSAVQAASSAAAAWPADMWSI